mmetsp:Transcript_63956/g.187076  ORF Transcript_63956/g.187076 Transcript_63956/m.187076 type:complete len:215 (+) Transcript_63956:404-1048(+)
MDNVCSSCTFAAGGTAGVAIPGAAATAAPAAAAGAGAAGACGLAPPGAFTAWTRTPSACARSRIFFFSTRKKWLMWSMGRLLPMASASFTTCRSLAPPGAASSAPMSSAIAMTPRSVAFASAAAVLLPSGTAAGAFAGSCEAPGAVAGGLFATECMGPPAFRTAPGLSPPTTAAASAGSGPGAATFAQSPEPLAAGVFTMTFTMCALGTGPEPA